MSRVTAAIMWVITLALINPIYSGEKEILLKLPVRVLSKEGSEKNLKKEDFKLYINGENREIGEFFKKSRSIEQTKTKRSFCLAFNFTDYGKQISDGISHFVQDILREDDKLLVWSPLKKIYRINPNKEKQAIIGDIEKIIKTDSLNYKQNLEISKQNLDALIENLRRQGLNTTAIRYFLNNYASEFNNFKNRYLIPDLNNLGGAAALMARDAGEKWLINFQEREVIPAIQNYRKLKEDIRNYTSGLTGSEQSWAASINSGLNAIDKAMLISENFPTQEIMNLLLGINISYNVIFFKSMRKTSTAAGDTGSPDYEGILGDIARSTGGTSVQTNDLAEGLEAIKQNLDFYYELIFEFNGKLADKEIKIELANRQAKINHKTTFLKDEIKAIMDISTEPAVNISNYKLQGYNLAFTVSGYKIDKDEQSPNKDSGILRIEIKLIDDNNNVIFNADRTFKSSRESFDISLNLPAEHKGYFKLSIGAEDLISGRNTELNQYIKLK